MDYVPHDKKTMETMLAKIGVSSMEELYEDIPKSLLLEKLNLPEGLSEADLLKRMTVLSKKNHLYRTAFIGAGSYYHFIPSLVDYVISRSEFFTAYTPYQAEASQGFLQAIYEYQSAITRLTKMDVTNASMYDVASAFAEAATMCTFATRKSRILMLEGMHPEYIETVNTYCWGRNIQTEIVPLTKLEESLNDDCAGFLFQSPNFYGEIEDISYLTKIVREKAKKCKIVYGMPDPTCLGILKAPGDYDIDIFVSEGMGLPPSFGGPNLGIFATTSKLMRKMPGRVIGVTKEINGEGEGFVLTLQAREQHIRREKALSNICSNQSLCMLACLVYMVCLGKTGLKQVGTQNIQKANYVKREMAKIPGYNLKESRATYNEFVIECPNVDKFIGKCKENDILPPLPLSHYFPERSSEVLVCVTEQNSKEDIELFLRVAKEAAL
ncbi:glycine dehydrogenase (decarboxylating) subunit 1 [Candidatus Lokiarchaeum ossiferum]|uniref:Glycine dehydrogenase (Decarboxylating) subunit 1 n=1 Tax=Candidatus Lokiarchaeum ossiferum TaxID=2951803 RepID=A0ABY6HUW3_9ARCH|nr:glycine dehydrogenase (decarboxylating) subunit 1 [Candidatus Lokiarchaeum sp. B-35]